MQKIFISIISFTIFVTIFITIMSGENSANFKIQTTYYYWPTPNFHGISSYFGYRKSPTKGASSNHKGIDILANEKSIVCAISDGKVKYAGFNASGGYMVIISHEKNIESRYAHLDPNLYVKKGEDIKKGSIIGRVGPKYLKNGKLNGATTGVHLHLGILKDGEFIDPLKLQYD